MLTIKETGVQYTKESQDVFTHADSRGWTVAYVTRPLTYNITSSTIINPITKEESTTEYKVYVDDITEEEICNGVRVLRDLKFAETSFLVERHREELELGLDTTLTPAEYQEVLQYRQQLRDLPIQEGFPQNVVWPTYVDKT